jgi:hypothetical protein
VLTYEQAREFLGFPPKRMAMAVRKGDIPGILEDPDGRVYFNLRELTAYATDLSIQALRRRQGSNLFPPDREIYRDLDALEPDSEREKRRIRRTEEDCPNRARFMDELRAKRAICNDMSESPDDMQSHIAA